MHHPLPILSKGWHLDWKVNDENLEHTYLIFDDTEVKLNDPKNKKILDDFLNTIIPWGSSEYPVTPDGKIILKLHNWLSIDPNNYDHLEFTPDLLPTNQHLLGAIYTYYNTPLTKDEIKAYQYYDNEGQVLFYTKQRGGTLKMVDLNLDHVYYDGFVRPSPGVYELFLEMKQFGNISSDRLAVTPFMEVILDMKARGEYIGELSDEDDY